MEKLHMLDRLALCSSSKPFSAYDLLRWQLQVREQHMFSLDELRRLYELRLFAPGEAPTCSSSAQAYAG